jgi:hypothetical protein
MMRIVGLAVALLAGCVSMSEADCRTADWYYLGEQDARTHGLQPQINQIAFQCQKLGVQVPEQDYMDGWYDGDRQRAARLTGGGG